MGENVVFYAFAYQQILLLFLNNSNKNGVRKHAHSMSHAYLDILVKVSSDMLQNCGNAYVKFNSASYLQSILIYRDMQAFKYQYRCNKSRSQRHIKININII